MAKVVNIRRDVDVSWRPLTKRVACRAGRADDCCNLLKMILG